MSKQCKECGNELKDLAKFCSKCGSKCEDLYESNEVKQSIENNAEMFFDKLKKGKKQIIAIIVGIVAVCILVVSILGGSSEVTFSAFLGTYNKLSQKEFKNNGITGWNEVEFDDMQEVQAEATLFKNPSDVTTYGYLYQGMVSNPGAFMIYVDEDDSVLGYSFIMSVEYIAGNDDFHNIVLESLMNAYADLTEDEIYEIKSNFSMQDSLIGVITRADFGKYEYKGILYAVLQTEDGLTFSAYLADELAEAEDNGVDNNIKADEQNEEQTQNMGKDFSIIEGTWRQSSIYPSTADISEVGGGEIIISEMNEKGIEFIIRNYSGSPDYKMQEYKVTDYEMSEEYGEYIITFTAEKGMRGTLTITELTGKEKTLELAIHSDEETYTRGTGFYNKVSSNVDVEDTKVSGESESQVDEEVEENDVDVMDELLCLVGKDVHWYELGRMNEYEEHMEAVLKPWVLKLMEEHSFYSGTTMIKISEYDRNKRIYFVMIYDDLNSGNYAGFYVNLSNDEVTFSQGDSNVVIQ